MKTLARSDRPREKLDRLGPAALGDNELLAIVLGAGTRGRSALDLANAVLAESGGVHRLPHAPRTGLGRIAGVGPARAAQVMAAVELGRRTLTRPRQLVQPLLTSAEVAAYLMPHHSAHGVEHLGVLLFDVRMRPLRTVLLSVGTTDAALGAPREVFRPAIGGGAASIAVFHNHPSGDPTPSRDDVELTWRLVEAGELLGIPGVDHVILADTRCFSFRTTGRLRP
jgi:DNA repair protein RadC